MIEIISEDLKRLSLCDSHIEKIIQKNTNEIVLEIDWAGLENYNEKKVSEYIIIGKCILKFTKIKNEKVSIDSTNVHVENKLESREIEFNNNLFDNGFLVLEDEFNNKKFKIGGIVDYYQKANGWLNWEFEFTEFELKWNNYITKKEWSNGKEIGD